MSDRKRFLGWLSRLILCAGSARLGVHLSRREALHQGHTWTSSPLVDFAARSQRVALGQLRLPSGLQKRRVVVLDSAAVLLLLHLLVQRRPIEVVIDA